MQTSPVHNLANVTSSQNTGAKQGAPEVPFNQMLSQQIADRGNAGNKTNESAKASEANASNKVNESNKAGDANKAEQTNKAGEAGQSAKPETDPSAKQTDSTDAAATNVKLAVTDQLKDVTDALQPDPTAAVPVSAELLALVASQMNQAATKAGDTAAVATDGSEGETVGKIDLHAALAPGRAVSDPKGLLAKDAELNGMQDKAQLTESGGKESASKANANFAATLSALERAADSKQSVQLATAKLQDALPGISGNATPQLQQTAFNIAQAATGQPTDRLTPHVGTPAWDQALGQKVVWMVAGSQQSASLTLNPPDLGPMQVVLHVSNGQADASFTSNLPEVRQALEAALPKLREMMSEAGIQLGQTSISTGMPNQQNKPGEQTAQNGRGNNQAGDAAETASRVTSTSRMTGGQGLVDTFA